MIFVAGNHEQLQAMSNTTLYCNTVHRSTIASWITCNQKPMCSVAPFKRLKRPMLHKTADYGTGNEIDGMAGKIGGLSQLFWAPGDGKSPQAVA